ncbi:alpha/beta hydrolase [Noviherbaspirillum massiliense]|uniref:alpha/beta hydrolase n=1 Tax=Noviherbaspirillum massiliense TaxID=1465823 RepID=UPI0002DAE4AB|nr:alpha/beta hydrolase [Noviherbaspirillum massiliense]
MNTSAEYYDRQFNVRAHVRDHAYVYTRWMKESARVRRMHAAILDVAFGEASGERLDFFPANRGGGPLLVFIHGGWWRSLDKSDFSFIAPAYTQVGFNVAVTNYTLAPAASVAEITRQQLRAIAWLYRNADQYDFDPNRIVVCGHSAGAHLTAMMLAAIWPEWGKDLPPDLVKGAILLSGVYDLEPVQRSDFLNADLKLGPEEVGLLSPARLPHAGKTPFITAVGGLESDEFKRQNMLIGEAWKANHAGDIPLPEANHLTICDAFATPGHPLHQAGAKLVSRM